MVRSFVGKHWLALAFCILSAAGVVSYFRDVPEAAMACGIAFIALALAKAAWFLAVQLREYREARRAYEMHVLEAARAKAVEQCSRKRAVMKLAVKRAVPRLRELDGVVDIWHTCGTRASYRCCDAHEQFEARVRNGAVGFRMLMDMAAANYKIGEELMALYRDYPAEHAADDYKLAAGICAMSPEQYGRIESEVCLALIPEFARIGPDDLVWRMHIEYDSPEGQYQERYVDFRTADVLAIWDRERKGEIT